MIPPELLDVILSYHRPVCCESFAGNPNYSLYWVYDKGALKEMLGMSQHLYSLIRSNLGFFLRRNPRTQEWLSSIPWLGKNPQVPSGLAAARSKIARKSYIGLGSPELKYNA